MTKENKDDCIMIAEFMGAKIIQREDGIVFDFPKKSGLDWWVDYDKKWDWLMPVLSKIEEQGCIIDLAMTSLGCVASISPVSEDISFNNESRSLIQSAYKSVVDYIKWYKN